MSKRGWIAVLLVLSGVVTSGGCAKMRRFRDWARYENRFSVFATPLYKYPAGFSSSYHRHLYGDDFVPGAGALPVPPHEDSGVFFPSSVEYHPVRGGDAVRPTAPEPDEFDPTTRQIVAQRRRQLLR